MSEYARHPAVVLPVHPLCSTLPCALGGWTARIAQAPLTSTEMWPTDRIGGRCACGRKVRFEELSLGHSCRLQVGHDYVTVPKARAPVWHPTPRTTATLRGLRTFLSRSPCSFPVRMPRASCCCQSSGVPSLGGVCSSSGHAFVNSSFIKLSLISPAESAIFPADKYTEQINFQCQLFLSLPLAIKEIQIFLKQFKCFRRARGNRQLHWLRYSW